MNVPRLDPDLSAVPAQLRRLAAKCLVRDPKLRMRDIGDARMLLEEPQLEATPAARRSIVPWTIAWPRWCSPDYLAAIAGAASMPFEV